MRFIITRHARDQMHERGVEKEEVIRAIKRGSKFKQTEGLLAAYGYIRVAYCVKGDAIIVKTVMVERGETG